MEGCPGPETRTLENGTLPMTASNEPASMRTLEKSAHVTSACGTRAAHTAAAVGSISTACTSQASSTPSGASRRMLPAPAPGSSTRPPEKPISCSADQRPRVMPAGV